MRSRALATTDFEAIHRAFGEAFGDYAVPFNLTPEQLREMLRRRGWAPEASVGIFDGARLVAFTLNGLGTWRGAVTGYDTGTGVVPSHRGRGLSRRMIDESIDLLRAHAASQYLLEVIQTNERALGVYRRAGFEITRELQCWTREAERMTPAVPAAPAERDPSAGKRTAAGGPYGARADIACVDEPDWSDVARWFDVEPSWQNSIQSVRRAAAPRMVLGGAGGIVAVFESGDVPFAAVAPAARRRGLGRALIAAAAHATARALQIRNVEGEYAAAFLEACGAQRTVRQFEMLRPL
jgi:ribosomal protein S18 acetylase RimI-like enzyme